MAFPGRCSLLPGSLPPPWLQAGSPNACRSWGRPGEEGSGGNAQRTAAPALPWRGQGWGSPARGGGEGESGQGSVAVMLCPPAHLWDRGSGAGAKGRSGWPAGSEAAPRRRALTSDVDRQHGASPGVTREIEAGK